MRPSDNKPTGATPQATRPDGKTPNAVNPMATMPRACGPTATTPVATRGPPPRPKPQITCSSGSPKNAQVVLYSRFGSAEAVEPDGAGAGVAAMVSTRV